MDHRAIEEAQAINGTKHEILRSVGGAISPEMEIPKLKWLKNHQEEVYHKANHFFDLSDWLSFRLTNNLSRSVCALTCKWLYQPQWVPGLASIENAHIDQWLHGLESDGGWCLEFFRQNGMQELITNYKHKVEGDDAFSSTKHIGEPVSGELASDVAEELQLKKDTIVSTSIIDAHAGTIGLLSTWLAFNYSETCLTDAKFAEEVTSTLALILGTSACHMKLSRQPLEVKGSWGPYFSAVLPGYWLNESGQSAFASLIDRCVASHPSFKRLLCSDDTHESSSVMQVQPHHYAELNSMLLEIALNKFNSRESYHLLTTDKHIYPDIHGNRSPLADPHMTACLVGYTMEDSKEDLTLTYLAAVQSLALQTKQIIENMERQGHQIKRVALTGGPAANPVLTEVFAKTLNRDVLTAADDAVTRGCAVTAATASGLYPDLKTSMVQMGRSSVKGAKMLTPSSESKDPITSFYEKKYLVYHRMQQDQLDYRSLMEKLMNSD